MTDKNEIEARVEAVRAAIKKVTIHGDNMTNSEWFDKTSLAAIAAYEADIPKETSVEVSTYLKSFLRGFVGSAGVGQVDVNNLVKQLKEHFVLTEKSTLPAPPKGE